MNTILIILVGLGVLYGAVFVSRRILRERAFRSAVGLTLEEVCALLPSEIRNRRFTRLAIGAPTDDEIPVALLYEVERPFAGNPPNVGVVFDRRSGLLLRVCPDGIGLGLK